MCRKERTHTNRSTSSTTQQLKYKYTKINIQEAGSEASQFHKEKEQGRKKQQQQISTTCTSVY